MHDCERAAEPQFPVIGFEFLWAIEVGIVDPGQRPCARHFKADEITRAWNDNALGVHSLDSKVSQILSGGFKPSAVRNESQPQWRAGGLERARGHDFAVLFGDRLQLAGLVRHIPENNVVGKIRGPLLAQRLAVES